MHKASLEEGIETLVSSITELRRLRKRTRELTQAGPHRKRLAQEDEPPSPNTLFLTAATYSASFVDLFSKTWSCVSSSGTHSTHKAKLFLDHDITDECVSFRMVLEYEATTGKSIQRYVSSSVWRCLQSFDSILAGACYSCGLGQRKLFTWTETWRHRSRVLLWGGLSDQQRLAKCVLPLLLASNPYRSRKQPDLGIQMPQ